MIELRNQISALERDLTWTHLVGDAELSGMAAFLNGERYAPPYRAGHSYASGNRAITITHDEALGLNDVWAGGYRHQEDERRLLNKSREADAAREVIKALEAEIARLIALMPGYICPGPRATT